MIFTLFIFMFRVIQPEKIRKVPKYSVGCIEETDSRFVEYTTINQQDLCRSSEVHLVRCEYGGFTLTHTPLSCLIDAYCNFYAEKCQFHHISFAQSLLSIWGNDDGIYSPKMYNCDFWEVGSYKTDTRVIYSGNHHNTFRHNTFKFTNYQSGQIFHFRFHSGTILDDIYVSNSKYDWDPAGCRSSAISFEYNQQTTEYLEIKNCVFKSCKGRQPAVLFLDNLNYDLTLQNITLDGCESLGGGEKILIRIWAYNMASGFKNNPQLTFKNCKFLNLNGYSAGGGGIGLLFTNNNEISDLSLSLRFENTDFEHVKNTQTSEGGGAISLTASSSEKENCSTILTVSGCLFNDISCNTNGGAIYYYLSTRSVFISGSRFTNARASNDGNAIYIDIGGSTVTTTISSCVFTDCGSSASNHVVAFHASYFNFLYNTITFTNPDSSSGCIHTSRNGNHFYNGNTFRNAKNNYETTSPCIQEKIDSYYLTIKNNTFDGICSPCHGKCFLISSYSKNTLTIQNNTFSNCRGGGSYAKITFSNSISMFTIDTFRFVGNEIDDYWYKTNGHCPQIWIQSALQGSGFTYMVTLTFSNCYFEGNYNKKNGGAIDYGKNRLLSNTKVIFESCRFVRNHAEGNGGALSLMVYQGCTIDKCTFIGNYAAAGSGAIYIETIFSDNSKPNSYPSGDRSPSVTITQCSFSGNGENKASNEISISSSSNAPAHIANCDFSNTRVTGFAIDISSASSTVIQNCGFESESNEGSGGIFISSAGTIGIEFVHFISTSKNAALKIASTDTSNPISITKTTFDSCKAEKCSCFDISIETSSFTFADNIVSNTALSGYANYIGSIDLGAKCDSLEMKNVSFINNVCSSLYGGGIGTKFLNVKTSLHFLDCKFTNNGAKQDTSFSRPRQSGKGLYFNGDGGGIQLGYDCDTYQVSVKFERCTFSCNKAQRHGGALAIQTLSTVEIIDCIFDKNEANYNFDEAKSELLVENHFDKKSEGRGGAIYINPVYTYEDSQCDIPGTTAMKSFSIKDSTIQSNTAHDGYAIYVESDDNPETTFLFDNINFFDNYNLENHDSDKNKLYGAVITSEIYSIKDEDLNKCNFSNFNDKIEVKRLSYVDHYGKTPTKKFTESNYFTRSDYFPTNSFTGSKIFSISDAFSISNKFTESNDFSHSNDFSESDYFTKTSYFTKSSNFGQISYLTSSNAFSKLSYFTKMFYFSQTNDFTDSRTFSKLSDFTNANAFSETNDFSKSNNFGQTSDFTSSNAFSKSSYFTRTFYFSQTSDFTDSMAFTKSSDFTTDYFSKTNPFSGTNYFSRTNDFTRTNGFSESWKFTTSEVFISSDFESNTNSENKVFNSESSSPQEELEITNKNSDISSPSFEFLHTTDYSDVRSSSSSSSSSLSPSSLNLEFYFKSSVLDVQTLTSTQAPVIKEKASEIPTKAVIIICSVISIAIFIGIIIVLIIIIYKHKHSPMPMQNETSPQINEVKIRDENESVDDYNDRNLDFWL